MKYLLVSIFAVILSVGVAAKDSHNHNMDAMNNNDGAKVEQKADSLVPQKSCPVMGGEINKKLFVDVNGKRIYVCCRGCYAPIKKDPEKYIKILKDKGEAVETIKK